MGVADVVPGVSGGTVALLTGIYPRLIAALSAFDFRALRLLRTGQFTTLARTVDLRFLIALGAGVGVGLITTLLTVVKLLGNDTSRPWVLASFLGMLLAAAWIMLRTMLASAQQLPGGTRYHPGHWGWSAVGLSVALAISLMQQGSGVATPSFGYIFLCGIIGISAMILPGISGAMLLLLLGVYGFLVHIPAELLKGEHIGVNLMYLTLFGGGCVTGLLTTTKVLKWLLEHWPRRVTCFLFGLMIGALPCLWPFQINQTPDQPKLSLRIYESRGFHPEQLGDWVAVGCVIIAAVAVIGLDRVARAKSR